MARYAVGVDIGTTAVKALVVDREAIRAEASRTNTLYAEYAGWAEEEAGEWLANAEKALAEALAGAGAGPDQVAAIGVSGMVPAIVCCDRAGRPLRRAIQQNDGRAAAEVEELAAELGQDRVFARTGSYVNQQHVGPRLRWLQRHEPGLWARTEVVCGSYDYVAWQLTGQRTIEANWALESGLFDLRERRWIPEYLAAAGVREEQLGSVNDPLTVVGGLRPEVAARLGLLAGTPVIAGSADHVASAFAAGLREQGDTLVKFGGAGDILYVTEVPQPHPRLYIDYHDIPGQYLLNGCMAASGTLVRWWVEELLGEQADSATLRALDEAAARLPPGSDGLVVLPYFLEEKTPLFDPQARGVFFGLGLQHRREHVFRAILEAVAFGFRHHLEVLAEAGKPVRRLRATNGGVKSALWRGITASVLGRRVEAFRGHPGSSLGVAYLAGVAGGLFADWASIERFLGEPVVVEPDPEHIAAYDRAYALYRALYPALKPHFAASVALQQREG